MANSSSSIPAPNLFPQAVNAKTPLCKPDAIGITTAWVKERLLANNSKATENAAPNRVTPALLGEAAFVVAALLTSPTVPAFHADAPEPMEDSLYIYIIEDGLHSKIRRAWALQDFQENDENGVRSWIALVECDCQNNSCRRLSFSLHSKKMARGEELGYLGSASEMEASMPNTVMDSVLRYVCSL